MTASTVKTSSRQQPRPDPARVTAAKVRLVEAGTTATEWARRHGHPPAIVHKVLSGTRACVAGEGAVVARKLGIVDADAGEREAAHG